MALNEIFVEAPSAQAIGESLSRLTISTLRQEEVSTQGPGSRRGFNAHDTCGQPLRDARWLLRFYTYETDSDENGMGGAGSEKSDIAMALR